MAVKLIYELFVVFGVNIIIIGISLLRYYCAKEVHLQHPASDLQHQVFMFVS